MKIENIVKESLHIFWNFQKDVGYGNIHKSHKKQESISLADPFSKKATQGVKLFPHLFRIKNISMRLISARDLQTVHICKV